jgi:ABC-type transport system substrate-binding protein
MRKPPFDDIRVRVAMQKLYDREKFNDKLFFNEYTLTNSYFPATPYANPGNPIVKYDLDGAIKLLEEAGYTSKNSEGFRMKDGKVLELELPFTQPSMERYLTIFQEDLKKAGIKLNLKQVDGTTNFKIGNERNFTMLTAAWGGQNPPSLDFNIISRTADDPNSTNWPGFKSQEVDKYAAQYNLEYDKKVRIQLVRKIDSIAVAAQPYIFGWYADYVRLEWHNKFGMPKWIVCRFDDYYGSTEAPIFQMWWFDPEKAQAYEEALTDKGKKMEVPEVVNKFWLDVAGRENKGENVVLNQ